MSPNRSWSHFSNTSMAWKACGELHPMGLAIWYSPPAVSNQPQQMRLNAPLGIAPVVGGLLSRIKTTAGLKHRFRICAICQGQHWLAQSNALDQSKNMESMREGFGGIQGFGPVVINGSKFCNTIMFWKETMLAVWNNATSVHMISDMFGNNFFSRHLLAYVWGLMLQHP